MNSLPLKNINSYQRDISLPQIHMLKHNPQSEGILEMRPLGGDLVSMMEFMPL